ncbi:hypothetical protein Tco_1009694, partial [Tanacetum coccineum]
MLGRGRVPLVCPIVKALVGRFLGAYDLGVATRRVLVHTGDKTSGDARSWYMINGDAKLWDVTVLHIFIVILHNYPLFEILAQRLVVLHDALRVLVDMSLVEMMVKDVPLIAMWLYCMLPCDACFG